MKKETERCLGCGAVQVDEYKCVGCGVCTTKCMFDAITLRKVKDAWGAEFEKLPLKVAPYAAARAGKIAKKVVKTKLGR